MKAYAFLFFLLASFFFYEVVLIFIRATENNGDTYKPLAPFSVKCSVGVKTGSTAMGFLVSSHVGRGVSVLFVGAAGTLVGGCN